MDPFLGVGTTVISSIKNKRKGVGAEIDEKYYNVSVNRTKQQLEGTLPIRDDIPVYKPPKTSPITRNPFVNNEN